MFEFTAKCERHPRYNPERDGRGGIKGGCSTCFCLYDLYQARLTLDAAYPEFLKKAIPWTRSYRPRNKFKVDIERETPLDGTTVQQ